MLFERRLREGIHDGSITLAFRRWRRLQVTAGGRYRPGLDLVEVVAWDEVGLASISAVGARQAGYGSVEALRSDLRGDAAIPLYRLEFRRLDEPDPRTMLAASADLSDQDAAEITRRLARLDRNGTWTLSMLRLIAARPGTRAADLALEFGCEKEWLKGNVRKLKDLGLTISLDTGYRLSPRGEAYLKARGGPKRRSRADGSGADG